jgi:hypothetical protein
LVYFVQMKLTGWRLGGVIAFALFSLMELGDFAGLVPGFSNPQTYADLIGISPQAETVRLAILSVLSLAIVFSSDLVIVGLLRRFAWTELASRAVGALFILYGLYQIVSANLQLTKNQTGVMIAGLVYALIGVLTVWIGARASRAD